jgi:hypothetical protein
MLGGADPGGEGGLGVVGEDGHLDLAERRAGVDAGGDAVDGAAVDGLAGGQDAGVGVEAGVGGQQGGVDVQHAAGPGVDQPGRQDAHVAGQGDPLGARLANGGVQRAFVSLAVRTEGAVVDRAGRDAEALGAREARGGGVVGEDEDDLVGRLRRAGGLNQRLHVAAFAGDKDGDARLHAGRSSPQTKGSSPASKRAPRVAVTSSGAVIRRKPTPQLKVRRSSWSAIPPSR